MARRAVFILGMHRSGTSLVAALLRMAGVDLGADLLVGGAEENSKGFWEHRDVVRLNEGVLARLGLSWFVPSPLPPRYLEDPRVASLADHAAELLRREFADSVLWGIKDPRLCRLQGLWERASAGLVDRLDAVLVFRHPLEVADSLLARNRMPAEQALSLWLFHNLEAVLHPRQRPLVAVPMPSLVEDPLNAIAAVRAALGEHQPLSVETAADMRRFVDPTLRHHRSDAADGRLETPVGRLAARCHACLEQLAAGVDTHAELAELRRHLLDVVNRRRQSLASRAHGTVDVIVPAYGGLDSTMRCIDSVLAGGGRRELVVINDASPDPALTERLRNRATEAGFQLIENPRNTGFVAAANLGTRLHPDRDVVLLNADTVVPPGWLDRLQRAAYSNEWIGTVTPFSNNATLCSYPLPQRANPIPPGHDVESLDTLFQAANAGLCLDVPTAVGFCMYLRRDCLDAVGAFDERNFGRGYGEETDFSMRAGKLGWRNVAAADVFVYHEGGVSFGQAAQALRARAAARMQALHPEYGPKVEHFLAQDPLAFARAAVDEARATRRGPAELALIVREWGSLLDMRQRSREREKDTLLRDLRRLDEALGHAQRLAVERQRQIDELTAAFHAAERFAREHCDHATHLGAELRIMSDAKAEAERIATSRLDELVALDRQLRDTAAALAAAEVTATDRLVALQSLDDQLRATAEALSHAESLATERLIVIEKLSRAVAPDAGVPTDQATGSE